MTSEWGGGGQRGVQFMWPMEPKEREDCIGEPKKKYSLVSPLLSEDILPTWLPSMLLTYGAMVCMSRLMVVLLVKNLPSNAGNARDVDSIPGYKLATHSSILAWTIIWTEEPGGL